MKEDVIIIDTETTGFKVKGRPTNHPDQPHIVQLAAARVSLKDFQIRSSINLIFKPEGWVIPPETTEVHRISQEYALRVGVPAQLAMRLFWKFWGRDTTFVAHNWEFDEMMLQIAIHRHLPEKCIQYWRRNAEYECTMEGTRDIIKLPPTGKMLAAGYNEYKRPKLEEAYRFFKGTEMENAHDAMFDVAATIEVFKGWQQYVGAIPYDEGDHVPEQISVRKVRREQSKESKRDYY